MQTHTTAAVTDHLFFHLEASSSCAWTQRTRLILHFVQTRPRACRTRSAMRAVAKGLIVLVDAGSRPGGKQQLLQVNLQVTGMIISENAPPQVII